MDIRVGQGIDVHPFKEGRSLILGGVTIPYEKGLVGHSDADVLTHALMDALLGACGKSDIGHQFPNTDERWRDADSIQLLKQIVSQLSGEGWSVMNADITLLAEAPKISPYISEMKRVLSHALLIEQERVAIKATTTEKLGFIGRTEGICAFSVVLVSRV